MDQIFKLFLVKQAEEGAALAAASDLLQLRPIAHGAGPAQHFLAHFDCMAYVLLSTGQVGKHAGFDVGIYFPDDYLRQANTFQVLTWLHPETVHHPNIRPPYICVGERFMRPGTPLVEICFQLHSVITYRKWAAHAGINPTACQWAIGRQELFPSDPRPLKRRKLELRVASITSGGQKP